MAVNESARLGVLLGYKAIAESTRKAIDEAANAGDADTADLFTAVSRTLDKLQLCLEARF